MINKTSLPANDDKQDIASNNDDKQDIASNKLVDSFNPLEKPCQSCKDLCLLYKHT